MLNKNIKITLLTSVVLFISACNGFFDKDNTPAPKPLTNFKAEVRPHLLWSTRTGAGSGSDYLKMRPSIDGNAIYTAGNSGTVTAVNRINGQTIWRTNSKLELSAGPGAGDGIVVVCSNKGEVVALSELNGGILWRGSISAAVLAQPAVDNNTVVIKSVDGGVHGLSVKNGQVLWTYQQPEPNLILRAASTPIINDNNAIVGFANGNLAKINLHDGLLSWQQTIAIPEGAFSIQRMIDIDADPVLFEHHIYVATYQGKIESLDWASGRVLWSHDISSYTGMVADENAVFISDASSYIWAFNADSGFVNWRQNQLEWRIVSGPTSMGRYIVVGDAEGYLHWLDKSDGHFVAREKVGSAVYAAPIVENNILYAQTSSGYLVAYSLS